MKTEFTPAQLQEPATAVAAQAIRTCVHCGFCTATCPTYVLLGDERDSPRGRIYLMKEMLEKELQPTAQTVKHIDRCLSCLSCVTTCPSGVDYMHLVDHSRAYIEERYQRPPGERWLRWVLAHILPYSARMRWTLRLGRLASPASAITRKIPALNRFTALLGLAKRNPSPRERSIESVVHRAARGTVILQQGCAEPVLRPQFREATVRLLNRLGYQVEFARGEGCCGALVHHMGRDTEALTFIRRNVDVWSRVIAEKNIKAIIVTASGCGTSIKDYGFILRNDPEYAARAAKISSLARDVSEFIEPDDLKRTTAHQPLRVAYHAACSLQHGQKILAAPRRLLEAAGFEVVVPANAHLCCGSAGTYNILQPEIAAQLGARKAASLEALRPAVIATGNVGCAVQIEAHGETPVVHIVELLDWATGGPPPVALVTRPAT